MINILVDSIADNGVRLTSFECTYARFIHSQVLTHRMIVKNSSSSRAIKFKNMKKKLQTHPVYPQFWGLAEKGMQAYTEADIELQEKGKAIWKQMMDAVLSGAEELNNLGFHQQIVNRPTEWFGTITTVMTATDWIPFFKLRTAHDAQPEIQLLATQMQEAYNSSTPKYVGPNEWHTPYIQDDELFDDQTKIKVSIARCARASYLTQRGTRSVEKDLELFDMLISSGHMSPTEHVATPMEDTSYRGCYQGWNPYRKTIPNEYQW